MKLPKSRIIRSTKGFAAVRKLRRTGVGWTVLVGIAPQVRGDGLPSRFGFVTPKYLGGAVVRNLVRRRLRHVVIDLGLNIPPGFDVVTVARRPASNATFSQIRSDWWHAARKVGLISRNSKLPAEPQSEIEL